MACGFINIQFNLNHYRKTNYLIGHGIMGLNWAACAVSYWCDSFIYPIIAGFVIGACSGGSFIVAYYTIVAEVCGVNLYFVSILSFILANFAALQIAPYC